MTGYVGPIEKQTTENTYFRQVLFTGPHSQLVVMCLRPGEDIGDEVHPHVDQFFADSILKNLSRFQLFQPSLRILRQCLSHGRSAAEARPPSFRLSLWLSNSGRS